ncbi:hypothetical protein Q8A67_016619 [Cirrhinus molitorella]|uniref:Uncharacterized protein n=1 Tax=Cirrhinus molitorella TaxID=172907 RepID=A0AA88TJC1_9TELE|nr:hypothetical protein Q8A67_016619 [Cirrhinus molitorella]
MKSSPAMSWPGLKGTSSPNHNLKRASCYGTQGRGEHLRKVPFLSLRCSQSPLDPSPQRANQSTETVDRSGVRREEQIGQATPVYVIAEALSALFN